MDYAVLIALIVQAIQAGETAAPVLIAAYKQIQNDLGASAMTQEEWAAYDQHITQAYGTDAWKTDAQIGK